MGTKEMYSCETCKASYCSECERKKAKRKISDVTGKAFMDVFKYVLTAVLIATFLGGMRQIWEIYVVGLAIAFVAFGLGYYFMNYKK